MKNSHVLVLMEWSDHPIRQGMGRYAAEHNWYLTVIDGCMTPKGWSGDGILKMINARADIIGYVRRQSVPCVDFGAFRPDIPLARVCGDHRQIGRVAADHLIERGFTQSAYFSTEYLRPHEPRGIGVADAAEAVRVPPYKLEEHFTLTFGQTVYATLVRLRLFEAKRLLTLTELPVKEIARRTGFCHAQHLSNAFRRAEHLTPLAFRKRERQSANVS